MKKIETIWHHVLHEALHEKAYRFTQQGLAGGLGCSLSTVHHALRVPTEMGAIRQAGRFSVLTDYKKLLYYWASVRKLRGDILYATYVDSPVRRIEADAIPESAFAGYTAAAQILGEPPSDYAKVYFYIPAGALESFRRRYPAHTGKTASNAFALKMPAAMKYYGTSTTLTQTFVDIWNMGDWYSREFTNALENKIDGLLP